MVEVLAQPAEYRKARSLWHGYAAVKSTIAPAANAAARSLRAVNGSMPSITETSIATAKLILAIGMTMLASLCASPGTRKLATRHINIPEASE